MLLFRRALSSSPSLNRYKQLNEAIRQCKTAQQIERLVWQNKQYNAINIATALHQLKLTKSTSEQAINRLVNAASQLGSRFDPPQALSASCHAIAAGKLLPKLPRVFLRHLEGEGVLSKFSPQSLSNVMWSLAVLGHHQAAAAAAQDGSMELLTRLVRDVRGGGGGRDLGAFNSQDLADVLWCLAVIKQERSALPSVGEFEFESALAATKINHHITTALHFKPRDLVTAFLCLHQLGQPANRALLAEIKARPPGSFRQHEMDAVRTACEQYGLDPPSPPKI